MRTALVPLVDDQAPRADTLTTYDEKHRVTYLRLLDAEAEGAGWDEAALLVLRIDPIREPVRARRIWKSHIARAKWLVEHAYGRVMAWRTEFHSVAWL